jgi:hypothetical protein
MNDNRPDVEAALERLRHRVRISCIYFDNGGCYPEMGDAGQYERCRRATTEWCSRAMGDVAAVDSLAAHIASQDARIAAAEAVAVAWNRVNDAGGYINPDSGCIDLSDIGEPNIVEALDTLLAAFRASGEEERDAE